MILILRIIAVFKFFIFSFIIIIIGTIGMN